MLAKAVWNITFPPEMLYDMILSEIWKRVPNCRIPNCLFTTTSPSASESYNFLVSIRVLVSLIYTKGAKIGRQQIEFITHLYFIEMLKRVAGGHSLADAYMPKSSWISSRFVQFLTDASFLVDSWSARGKESPRGARVMATRRWTSDRYGREKRYFRR